MGGMGARERGVQRDLIYDIGVNHGEDTQLYLKKGFRVVGVEANPILADENRLCLKEDIEAGRLVIENCGIMSEPGELPFYVNLFCDHWSSFFKDIGARDGTPYKEIRVSCITILDLIERHGCPRYMKIDVEGADRLILDELKRSPILPDFISVEEFGTATFDALVALGYDRFSIRPQLDKSWAAAVTQSREGQHVEWEYTHRCSGLFGCDVPDWLPLAEAKAEFQRKVRDKDGNWLPPPGEFYDIHGASSKALEG